MLNLDKTNGSEDVNVNVADRDDEFGMPNSDDDDDDEANEVVTTTRSGRISKPYDWAKKFPETANFQEEDVR